MGTFNSTGSGGNWTDDSTWAESGQPAADGTDHVIITAGDTVTLTANTGTGSIKISGTIEGGGYTLTLSSSSSNKPFDHDGTIDSGSDLNVTITNTGAQQDGLSLDANQASQGNINDLTLNLANGTTANKTVTLLGATTIDGDLTITSGTLDTSGSNHALNVTGSTTGAGNLALNSSTYTGNGSGHLSLLGTLTIGTSGVITGVDQLGENGSGGGTITCTGSPTLGCERWRQLASKWTPATSTIKVEDASNSWQDSVYGVPYNFEIDNAGNTNELAGTFNVTNNLTITAGTLSTGSTGRAMTVGGDVSVSGTLDLDAASSDANYSFRSLTIESGGTVEAPSHGIITLVGQPSGDYMLRNKDGGTFTHNGGTLTISRSASASGKYAKFGEDVYNNVIIDETNTSGTSVVYIVGVLNVANDLTITDGGLSAYGGTGNVDVDGDVLISSGGVLDLKDPTLGAQISASFGSLTIASGGEYDATPGTTTITSMTSTGSGDRSLSLVSGGTFTNNSGTVLFNGGADQRLQMAGTGNLYNLTVNKSDNEFVTFGNLTIENNLDVTLAADHTWRPNATSDTLTVHGNTYLTTGRINNGSTQYAGTNNWGNVTINSGEFVLSSGTNNFTGIRNIGGTVSQS